MRPANLLGVTHALAAILVLFALPAQAQTAPGSDGFKRAIEEYVARRSVNQSRPCVNFWKIPPKKPAAFPDTRFDWTPASFVLRLDRETDPTGRLARVFGLAARHGYFDARAVPGDALEYLLTWKGYANTNSQGCFHTGSRDVDATVRSFERLAGGNWRVLATGTPRTLLPWTRDPEFQQLFSSYSDARGEYGTNPYEVTPSGFGFAVVDRRGPPETLGVPRVLLMLQKRGPRPEQIAKQVGVLTPERVRAALDDHVANATKGDPGSNRVCIWLPHMVDETNLVEVINTPEGQPRAPLHLTIYNYERPAGPSPSVLMNYDLLTRLEAAGLAKSERIPVTEFRGRKANGAVRFRLTDAGHAMIPRDQPVCVLVGHVEPVEILEFEQFTALNALPDFVARTKFTPIGGREALLARFRHLKRLAETGGAMTGNLYFVEGKLGAQGSYRNPEFDPDPAQLPPLPFESIAR